MELMHYSFAASTEKVKPVSVKIASQGVKYYISIPLPRLSPGEAVHTLNLRNVVEHLADYRRHDHCRRYRTLLLASIIHCPLYSSQATQQATQQAIPQATPQATLQQATPQATPQPATHVCHTDC